MAFKTLGIGGILSFSSAAAVRSMSAAHKGFVRLQVAATSLGPTMAAMGRGVKAAVASAAASMRALGGAAAQAGMAFKGMLIGAAPFALLAGMGAKAAVGFEQQMSAVQSVLLKDKEGMKDLSAEARRMGIVSVFSAKQAGEAMEYMARAGFKDTEIISSLQGVMDAAAADSIDLATATDIVANQIRAFNLNASEATRVANVLALTSARTNTNIIGLGEGLKYVAPIARGMGISIEETATTLGLLADSGMKGSLAGTAMKNALLRLASPTGQAKKIMAQFGLTVADASGNFVGMESILNQIATGMNQLGGRVNQTGAAARLFGLRGVAITNLLSRLRKSTKDGALSFGELHEQLKNAGAVAFDEFGKPIGAAAKMAEIRLDNVAGRLTLLKSSLESIGILIYGPTMGGLAKSIGNFTSGLNAVLSMTEKIRKVGRDAFVMMESAAKQAGVPGGGLDTIEQIALGIVDATEEMKRGWDSLTTGIQNVGKMLEKHLGGEGLRSLTKFLVMAGSTAAALIPIALAAALIGFVLKSTLLPAIKMVGFALRFAFSPLGLIIGGIVLVFLSLRKESETLGQTFTRVWGRIKEVVAGVWTFLDNTVFSFFRGLLSQAKKIGKWIAEVFSSIGRTLSTIFGWMVEDSSSSTSQMKGQFADAGAFIGKVLVGLLKAISTVFNALDDFIHSGQTWLQETMVRTEERFWRSQRAMGIISQETFEKQIRRLIFINKLTSGEKQHRAEVVKEREGEIGKLDELAKQAAESAAAPTVAATKEHKLEIDFSNMPPIKDERTLEINNTMNVDGRQVAVASTRHQAEVHERGGFKKTPWNRRAVSEFGVLDLSPAAAGGK